MSLRSKSSDNVLTTASNSNNSSFGSLNSSTESVCRTLRAYRKKLTTSSTTDSIAPETLRELEKELKLTARVVGEKSQGKNIDEAMMSRLLDQASEKIVSRLDERIKERVESEVRKSGEGSPTGIHGTRTSSIVEESHEEHMEAVAGALEEVSLGEQ
jgi:ribosomal protein L19E